MTGLLSGLSLLSFIINISYLIWIYRGLKKIEDPFFSKNSMIRSYSVIIAAHNEEDNISSCLINLINQNYPKSNYEIIIIADRCTDNTIQLVNQFKNKFTNLRLIEIHDVPTGLSSKKYALNTAIKEAEYDYFVFLDADVVPTEDHLKIINECFNDDVQVVVSLMKLKLQDKFWQNFLRYERLCNWAVAAGSIGNQTPIISYGGNWAYTRQDFDQVNGFEGIFQSLGGDDDLLLQKFGKKNLKVWLCTNPDGWVETHAPDSFQNFLQQRRRHSAAGKYYHFKFKIGYFLFHISNLILWIIWPFFFPAFILLGLKIFINTKLLKLSGKIFKEHLNKYLIVIYEFLFLLYSEFVGILGLLGKIRW